MKVAVRADASAKIGSGHVIRTLTLADVLRAGGATVCFISREFPGHLCDVVENCGYPTIRLPDFAAAAPSFEEDAAQTSARLAAEKLDWLIVDHYGLGQGWETAMRCNAARIMAIDDLADRDHDCDLLLDQNFFTNAEARYLPHLPKGCVNLLGPRFALLRPQFAAARAVLRERGGGVKRVLIYFGGNDTTGETAKALRALARNSKSLAVDVVVGGHTPLKEEIGRLVAEFPAGRTFFYVENMAELMSEADLFVGTAGSATWERCCLGLPSVVITTAANQIEPINHLAGCGVLLHAGHAGELTEKQLAELLQRVMADAPLLRGFTTKSMELVDGKGAERCAEQLALLSLQ
ncbi:UDP-2,4-diacetamido-2,4,6-trideoxy-beta-L-altropyranose hydrolase [Geomesophilobacter sediminis]|uniref:UDP-2,4-diacetamido-2,4, 6-trideoxy-beta-L-altropyranose hydrolase n=1 Tax=Geomesophilobacter sediminis TaxID=2798584 RepID=A0A8J7LVC9_9BACT|nr:UDP-2,4-diacetamido-2,4,6-trideoxy-beta-L-altropyranose hydrolase [Geomesophilobacter sediminis]MBJ6724840.1 UDP-2,4-diacetamido-2,4,6-trideoxy-beta-L-altropyranose hydrolase [Geomesophilobacter sediminis]